MGGGGGGEEKKGRKGKGRSLTPRPSISLQIGKRLRSMRPKGSAIPTAYRPEEKKGKGRGGRRQRIAARLHRHLT